MYCSVNNYQVSSKELTSHPEMTVLATVLVELQDPEVPDAQKTVASVTVLAEQNLLVTEPIAVQPTVMAVPAGVQEVVTELVKQDTVVIVAVSVSHDDDDDDDDVDDDDDDDENDEVASSQSDGQAVHVSAVS